MIKNKIFLLVLLTMGLSAEWVEISSNNPNPPNIELLSSNIETTSLSFSLSGFFMNSIIIENLEYSTIQFPLSASLLEKGNPDLPKFSNSIIIPDNKNMSFEIVDFEYTDYENINIAPSKGNLLRNIDPNTVPYTFNKIYSEDSFYPENIIQLSDPYILRDFRGITVQFSPIQYNSVTRILRVYSRINIEIMSNGIAAINNLERKSEMNMIDKEYKNIYNSQFINFNNNTRFDYLEDHGNMLIISDGAFLNTMQPFVDWKNLKGISTEIVNVSDIGSNSAAISAYVEEYYNNNNLTFLLLVGDIAQIPSVTVSGSASDVSYGCILGNDYYPEVIVGRFSGNSPAEIETQVERTIEYERYPQSSNEWYDNALGVASNQGPGFSGYTDDVFNEYLWDTVLSGFTYDNYQGIYDGSGGTLSQGIAAINNGVSLINYTGHGSISSWGNGAPLSTSDVNSLTNENLLPFVITVGCNVGEFNSTSECFSEAWLRATNNGEPTGAIAHFGSTISQSWEPPMHGQYGMNLILTESYDNHLTRSIGGITTNGCMYMNDAQGSSGINETKYWTFFGDPSVNIRTAPPVNLTVQHEEVILVNQDEFVVDIGEDGALAALSVNGQLLSSAYSVGGVAILQLGDAANEPGNLDLVVTGFNTYPYETEIMIIAPEGAYVVIDDIEVEYGSVDSGHLRYGQENNLNVNLSNVGSDDASNLIVSISTDNEYIVIVENTATYDNLTSNQSITIGGLNVSVDWHVPNGEIIDIVFQITSDDDMWESTIPFIAQSPEITLNSIAGNLNGGETETLEISLTNDGSAAINYPIVSLDGDMYVTINSSGIENAYYWDYIENNNQENLHANVTVSSDAPIGHVAELMLHVNNLNGGLDISFPIYLSVGQITENFELGFDNVLDWEFSGDADWEITTDDQYEGSYSAKSGNIDHNQTTQMSVTLDVVIDGNIEFYYRVASEYSPSGTLFYDGLQFYIDNEMMEQYQPTQEGTTPWLAASFPVTTGTHTFTWSYVKDGGPGATDMEEDCSWIDYIEFPPSTIDNQGTLGDVNNDGVINVSDIIVVVNMIVGNTEIDSAADINADGNIDVLDIVIIANIILGT